MTYAFRVVLAHQDRGFDAFARLFEILESGDHDLQVGRHEALQVPVQEVEAWQQDFLLARTMCARASVDGLLISIRIDVAPFPTLIATIPTDREELAVATTRRLGAAMEIDFGVLQRVPEPAPTLLASDDDRLAYLSLASVNLAGDRFESIGPVATGVVTLLSSRVAALSRSPLRLEDLQGLSLSSTAALQASGIGATSSQAPNRRRLSFVTGPSWVAPPRTQFADARDPTARRLEQKLALSANENDLVDFEDSELPPGTSLLFLTAPDAKAEMLGFQGSAMRWSRLERATLSEAAFIDCELVGSSLAGARLLELRLEGGRASYTSFSDAIVAGGLVRSCDLRRATFDRAALTTTQFRNCDLRGAGFDGATFDRVTFEHCRIDPEAVGELLRRGARIQ